MEDELKAYGLYIKQSKELDRYPIDFVVQDKDGDVCATVWGEDTNDIEWDCNHPYQCVEFGDDIEDQGQCLLCGSYCDWHYETEEDESRSRGAHNWYPRRGVGGMIEEYIKGTSDGGAL